MGDTAGERDEGDVTHTRRPHPYGYKVGEHGRRKRPHPSQPHPRPYEDEGASEAMSDHICLCKATCLNLPLSV